MEYKSRRPEGKTFYTQYGVGSSKYCVSYYDSSIIHTEERPYYGGIATFKNKVKLAEFCKSLINQGYKQW